jgi:hypothetical protein
MKRRRELERMLPKMMMTPGAAGLDLYERYYYVIS